MRYSLIILIFLAYFPASQAQSGSSGRATDTIPANIFFLNTVERSGETLPEIAIKEVRIIGRESTSRKFPYARYQRLVYNLKKVYPYALVVRRRLEEVNKELVALPDDKERRKYLRRVEKDVFGEYEDDVRDMTITQGKLLIKLIDRETLNTSYVLIQQYRGVLSAAFWQGIARLFGTNLKSEYDPYGEDAIIEIILMEIEAGKL